MAGQTSVENGKNGGRPPGSLNKETLKRQEILKAMQQRIMVAADTLLDSQFTLALGCSFLFKVEKYWKKVGKKTVLVRRMPKLVTSVEEIRQYLCGLVEQANIEDAGGVMPEQKKDPLATYYYITTQKPDNKAIDSLKHTVFGKAVQPIRFTDEEDDATDNDSKTKAKKAIAGFIRRHPRARRKKRN